MSEDFIDDYQPSELHSVTQFARCGCNNTCSCSVGAGSCTTVRGTGTPIDPYRTDVTVDGVTITCGPNGLQSQVDIDPLDTDTIDMVVTGGPAQFVISANAILTPDNTGALAGTPGGGQNLLNAAGPGLYVSCEDIQDCVGAAVAVIAGDCLVYDDANNSINVSVCDSPNNGLECLPIGSPDCAAGGLAVIPSSDANNNLVIGTDGRLYSPASAVGVDADGTDCLDLQITGAGTVGDPFVISGSPIIAPEPNGVECTPAGLAVIPSADPGNTLVFGADQRLFVPPTNVITIDNAQNIDVVEGPDNTLTFTCVPVPVTSNTPCLTVVGDTCNGLTFGLDLSEDPCNVLECRGNGLFVFGDRTALPTIAGSGSTQGPFGPFNGPTNAQLFVQCATIVNPSPCRAMKIVVQGLGTADFQRAAGNFELEMQYSFNTGPGGPWFGSGNIGIFAPSPGTTNIGSALAGGRNDFVVAPGGAFQFCARWVAIGNAALVNGLVTAIDLNVGIEPFWLE